MTDKLKLYLDLIRWNRPAGWLLLLWPSLAALWVAAGGFPGWQLVVVFTLGTILMRSAGCCINDVADRDFDKHVKRTANRPVTSGRIGTKEALLVGAVLAVANGRAEGCPWHSSVTHPPVSSFQSKILTLTAQMVPDLDEAAMRRSRMTLTTPNGSASSGRRGLRGWWATFRAYMRWSLGSLIEEVVVWPMKNPDLFTVRGRGLLGPAIRQENGRATGPGTRWPSACCLPLPGCCIMPLLTVHRADTAFHPSHRLSSLPRMRRVHGLLPRASSCLAHPGQVQRCCAAHKSRRPWPH